MGSKNWMRRFQRVSLALIAIAICSSASSASAARKSSKQLVTVIPREVVYEGSSEYNRMDKSIMLTGQVAGAAVAPVPSFGANFGVFLDRSTILQVEGTMGSTNLSFADVDAYTGGANLKFFTGNSFYFKGGATYRHVSVYNFACSTCEANYKSDLGSVDSVAIEAAIGNQWQWSHFTVGCDWVGLMLPISTAQVENNYKDDPKLSAEAKEDIDRGWKLIGAANSISLLRLYIGASF